ncbi:MAG: class I SAM-dependent methyltransferase [Sulfolobales archaeon]|nr:class I SAM-dependent methyltransferase [Sulfolobales archaeon]
MLQKNPKIRALESVIKLPSLSKLLDIGCSTGDLTVYISNKLSIVQMFGVDIDDEALSKAKGIITYLLDISREKPPFTENSFEVCTMLDVIEHLENPDHVIKEVYRVLKRGGYLILSTPNLASWYDRMLLLLEKPILGIDLSVECRYRYPFGVTQVISGHRRLYTLDSLKYLLSFHSFKLLKAKGYPQVLSKTLAKGFIRFRSCFR